jgi:hypothetical protein
MKGWIFSPYFPSAPIVRLRRTIEIREKFSSFVVSKEGNEKNFSWILVLIFYLI